jgi:hypothetical protein
LFTQQLPFLSATDLEQIMGGSLARWLDWQ